MAFFFKLFPEIIEDGRLYIAEPPLYRVKDKNDPFVINMAEYNKRYAKQVSKNYIIGYKKYDEEPVFIDKKTWVDFLSETATYVESMDQLSDHYKLNGHLLEMILNEFAWMNIPMDNFVIKPDLYIPKMLKDLNIQKLMDKIGTVYEEVFYDDKWNLITGTIDMKPQSVEISSSLIRRCRSVIKMIHEWGPKPDEVLILKSIKTHTENELSLLGALKVLSKYQPDTEHRFKGLKQSLSHN